MPRAEQFYEVHTFLFNYLKKDTSVPLLPFEDFTSSVCCPLDGLQARRRVSLVVGLPP